jgi:hypothetical protein
VQAIPLGAQPIIVGGQKSGEYDPLAKYAGLKSAISSAQFHAQHIAGASTTLHAWGAGTSAAMVVTPIVNALEVIQGTVDRMPDNVPVSDGDLAKIRQQLMIVRQFSMIVNQSMQQIRGGVDAFLSHVVADHDALARGPYELAANIRQIEQQTSEAAMKYIINPMYAPIGNIIIQIGAQFVGAARNTQAVMSNALASHEAIRGAAGALATAAESARLKQEAAYDRAMKADAATISATLRQARVATALTSWKQFIDFFKRSGL